MTRLLLQLPTIDPTTRWLAIGAAVVTIGYAVVRPMMRKKDPLARRDTPGNSLAGQRAVERDMSNLLVELSAMARQITAQIDTRAAKLEALIKDADERIASLRTATPPAMISQYALAEPASSRAEEPATQVDPAHAEVYSLADEGKSPRDIAAKLGRPNGEIELILALRQAH